MKNMTAKELKNMARDLGVKGWWDMNKSQLLEAIEKIVDSGPEVVSDAPEDVSVEADVNTLPDEENASETIVDDQEQHHKKKNQKRLIEYNGKTQTLTAWAKELGIRHQTLYNRIVMKGWDVEKAFEAPAKKGVKINAEKVEA